MNQLTIIGNLTREPEQRSTSTGKVVTNFTVAVNRRKRNPEDQPEADFFRVAAWGALGESCAKYLAKGSKVCVTGSVQVSTYTGNDGTTRASLDIPFAHDVEFLSQRNEGNGTEAHAAVPEAAPSGGFSAVETDELPF